MVNHICEPISSNQFASCSSARVGQGGDGAPLTVVAAVEKDGMSRRRAAARFGVGISTVINWVRRLRETGSVAPGKMGGYKPKAIAGEHRAWLLQRAKDR